MDDVEGASADRLTESFAQVEVFEIAVELADRESLDFLYAAKSLDP